MTRKKMVGHCPKSKSHASIFDFGHKEPPGRSLERCGWHLSLIALSPAILSVSIEFSTLGTLRLEANEEQDLCNLLGHVSCSLGSYSKLCVFP